MGAPTGQTGRLWRANPSKAGFNIIAAGFVNPITATTFSATVGTSANLNDIVAKGVEWVRVQINPTGALAATTTATETLQVHYARDAIKRCLDKGLKVMFSVHVSTFDVGWLTSDIITAYPSGAKWLRYLYVLRRYAEMTKQFQADKLIVHLWNEVDSVTASLSAATWNAAMRVAQAAFRSRNRRSPIAISGTLFSSVDGVADIIPYLYEPRMAFCFTPYEPHNLFTHQGLATSSPVYKGYNRLSYPPIRSERAGIFTTIDGSSAADTTITVTFVNGSPTVTWGSAHGKAVGDAVYFTTSGTLPTGFLTTEYYYVASTPLTTTMTVSATNGGGAITAGSAGSGTHTGHVGAKADGKRYTSEYLTTPYNPAYVDARVNLVSTWATNNKVNNRRIVDTEHGCHGDFTTTGASESSRATWLADMKRRVAAKGYPQAIHHYDDDLFGLVNTGSFTLNDRFLVALGLTSTTSYETEATTLFTADSVARTTRHKGVCNATIKMLKDAGLWTKLVFLHMMRAEGGSSPSVTNARAQGILNWKNPGTNTITAVTGSLTWAAASTGNGYVPQLSGTDQYAFNINDNATGFTQNSAAYGLKRVTATSGSNGIDMTSDAFGGSGICVDLGIASQMSFMGANGNDFSSTAPPTENQSYPMTGTVSRTASGSYRSFRNGSFVEQVTHTSAAMSGTAIVLAQYNNKPNGQFAYAWGSSGLTDAEVALMHVILEFYEIAL